MEPSFRPSKVISVVPVTLKIILVDASVGDSFNFFFVLIIFSYFYDETLLNRPCTCRVMLIKDFRVGKISFKILVRSGQPADIYFTSSYH